jgi:hypothetical protein
MSVNGKRHRRHEPHVASKRALRLRLARQVARDQQMRPPPSVTLPRFRCLADDAPPDVGANASRPRYE